MGIFTSDAFAIPEGTWKFKPGGSPPGSPYDVRVGPMDPVSGLQNIDASEGGFPDVFRGTDSIPGIFWEGQTDYGLDPRRRLEIYFVPFVGWFYTIERFDPDSKQWNREESGTCRRTGP